ncbi:hypothetical protein C7S16_7044 [Burkholderia thailandensis]|uniref:Uncharacterized protein n=1 Tax=Burkholderia thailandensis TaxID=57975 RepID=A0AAW9D0Q6_BURTH|nr:hypothetical protein [Burkholderia thailandensis]MDW9253556.1 hypothetical protein [Burkholderia thailandensis]
MLFPSARVRYPRPPGRSSPVDIRPGRRLDSAFDPALNSPKCNTARYEFLEFKLTHSISTRKQQEHISNRINNSITLNSKIHKRSHPDLSPHANRKSR